MKLNKVALAIMLALPVISAQAVEVTVTPLVGMQVNDIESVEQPDAVLGLAGGFKLTPRLGVEAEYLRAELDNSDQQAASVNGYLVLGNTEASFQPYLLAGLGINQKSLSAESMLANGALGAFYKFSDALALRAEGRLTYPFDSEDWRATALAGLQVTFGGRNMPAVPVPPPAEPAPAPVVAEPVVEPVRAVVPPPAPVDTDGDGVTDDMDQCPNTQAGVVVDAKGCPQYVTEDLKMELRVFFDTNKSNVKDQYKGEITKVADKLKEFPEAKAKIEGHTDNKGARKLNERLSLARANSVKSMLVSEYGIAADRMSTEGFAYDRPIAPNTTVEGRAMNRRVYAVITGVRTMQVK